MMIETHRQRTLASLGAALCGPGALRLLLAWLVFVSHVSRLQSGGPAVMIFFMLSGYWVTQLYVQRSGSVAAYMRDRWLRIWPLLALVATATVVARAVLGQPAAGPLWSTLLLLGLSLRHHEVIGVAWSLDFELQFYLLLPLVLAIIAPQGAMLGRRALLLIALITPLGMWLLYRFDFGTVLSVAPPFAVGVAIQLRDWRPSGQLALASLLAFMAIGAAFLLIPSLHWIVLKTPGVWSNFDLRIVIPWCLVLAPFIAWNVHQPSSPRDRTLGNLSYPFYLVHFPLIGIGQAAGWYPAGSAGKLVMFGVAMVATVLLYVCYDRPIERWRVGLRRRAAVVSAQ